VAARDRPVIEHGVDPHPLGHPSVRTNRVFYACIFAAAMVAGGVLLGVISGRLRASSAGPLLVLTLAAFAAAMISRLVWRAAWERRYRAISGRTPPIEGRIVGREFDKAGYVWHGNYDRYVVLVSPAVGAATFEYAVDAQDYPALAIGQRVRVWLPAFHLATSRIELLPPDDPAA
jgi:hypothetical protein